MSEKSPGSEHPNALNLCIPTTFEISFLHKLGEINREFACKGAASTKYTAPSEGQSWAREESSTVLQDIDENQFRRYVAFAHSLGLEFNYTLNASCTDNLEFTERGHRGIEELLNTLSAARVDTVTAATPYLIEYIAENYPEFEVAASSLCYIDSLERVLTYEKLGADRAILVPDVNRNFPLLKLIRSKTKINLEIIANNACILKCPYRYYHNNVTAHVSQKIDEDPTGFSTFSTR